LSGILEGQGERDDIADPVADRRVHRHQLAAVAEEQLVFLARVPAPPQERRLRGARVPEAERLDATDGIAVHVLERPGPLEPEPRLHRDRRGQAAPAEPKALLFWPDDAQR